MPDEAPIVGKAPTPPSAPAVSPSEPKVEEFDLSKWRQGLDQRHMPAFEEYAAIKNKEVVAELQSTRTQLGIAKKAADPQVISMIGDHDSFLDELKQAAISLYGLSDQDVQDASTVRELRLLLRGLRTARPLGKSESATANGPETPAWKQFQEQREKGESQKQLVPPSGAEMFGNRGIAAPPVNANLSEAYAAYEAAHKSGNQPAIDRALEAMKKARANV